MNSTLVSTRCGAAAGSDSGWAATATVVRVLAGLLLVALWSGCEQKQPEIQYHYIYSGEARGVAAPAAGDVGGLGLAGAPSYGPADAKVVIVESSDFQCPYCSKAASTIHELTEQYPNDVRVVFVNNPLSFHKDALPAAKAALAAHVQGKFWEFHDLLFGQKRYDDAALKGYAEQLGLDMAKWEADRAGQAIADRIQHDQASVVALGARGTPAFFVNGTLVSGAQPLSKFQAEVNKAIEEADAALAQGIARDQLHRHLAGKNAGAGFVDSLIDGKAPSGAAPSRAAANRDKPAERGDRAARPEAPAGPVNVNVRPEDAFKGGKDAKVTVVEFSDFQCPFCSKVGPALTQIEQEYGDKVKIVFKHMPLGFHKDAKPAAMASVAANKQGKFWEYHDVLFQNQRQLSRDSLEKYAEQIGLDMDQFRRDMDDPKTAAQVDADMADAQAAGVRGTPTSFVNGNIVKGAAPFEKFKAAIDRELEGGGARAEAGANSNAGGVELDKARTKLAADVGAQLGNAEGKTTLVVMVEPKGAETPTVLSALERLARQEPSTKIVVQVVTSGAGEGGKLMAMGAYAAAAATPEKALRLLRVMGRARDATSASAIRGLAERAGIDLDKYDAALNDKSIVEAVETVNRSVRESGAKKFPAVFVNGRKATAARWDVDTLAAAIRAADAK